MITVVILALNEEECLKETTATMISAAAAAGNIPLDIIIINDGSTDRTPQIIRTLENQYSFVRSIHHAQNKGPGVGVKEAILIARYPKFIVTPGDNDLSKDLLAQLFSNKDKADLVLAYYLNMGDRGWFRTCLSNLYTWIYRAAFQISIYYINSPCLYPTEQLREIQIRSDRFGYSAEMTVKLLRRGCSFLQVGGERRIDDQNSNALSWKNLKEVASVFLNLIVEIKFFGRRQFNRKPVEVFLS